MPRPSLLPRPGFVAVGVLLLSAVAMPAEAGPPPPYSLNFLSPTPVPAEVMEGGQIDIGVSLTGACFGYGSVQWTASAEPTLGEADLSDFDQPIPPVLDFVEPMRGTPFDQLSITIPDDILSEGPERFELILRPQITGGILGCGSMPTQPEYKLVVTILDDDGDGTTTVDILDTFVFEGDAGTVQAMFDVQLQDPIGTGTNVEFQTMDGSALVNGGDYDAHAGTIHFAPGVTQMLVQVTVNGDTTPEPDEDFFVKLLNPDPNLSLGLDTARGEIRNDDGAPMPTLGIGDVTVTEGDSGTTEAVFEVQLDANGAISTVTVDYITMDGGAQAGQDYVFTQGTLIFDNSGQRGPMTEQIKVPVLGDTQVEEDESFLVLLQNPGGAVIVQDTGTGLIENDDEAPTGPDIVIEDATVTEGDSGTVVAAFDVVLERASAFPAAVRYATVNGTATLGDGDYQSANGLLVFPPGAVRRTVEVQVVGDTRVEGDEQFFVRLREPVGGILKDDEAVGTIVDDDEAALPELSIMGTSVDEGDEGATPAAFVVTLAPPSDVPVTVSFTTEDGSATADADYRPTMGTLTFSPGTTEQTIQVPVLGDRTPEIDETFTVLLSEAVGANLTVDKAEGTIVDDDEAAMPLVSIADASVREGDEGTTEARFAVTLSEPSSDQVSIEVATRDGTATAPADYQSTVTTLTFAPGETSKEAVVLVVGDTEDEDDETFGVDLRRPVGVMLGDGEAEGTIVDDDARALPMLSIDDVQVTEGDVGTSNATFTVSLSSASEQTVEVAFQTTDGTATAGSDYQAASGTVSFAPGATQQSVVVRVAGDTRNEPDETFTVSLGEASGATIADGEGTGTILDDDEAAPLPRLAIADLRVVEGNSGTSSAIFMVSLSAPSESPVQVDFATRDGSATVEDGDYRSRTGTLTFSPGQRSTRFNVVVVGDRKVEPDELFGVVLSRPQGATLADPVAQAVIVNDDAEPSLLRLIGPRAVMESDGAAVLTIERAGDLRLAASVTVAVRAGTASVGADFDGVLETVQWPAGDGGRRTVAVTIRDDNAIEQDETIVASLENPAGARVIEPSRLEVVIVDDDRPMRLEAIGDQEQTARVGAELPFQVRASRDDGAPVAGAPVVWALEGDARFAGDATQPTDEQGTSTQTVEIGDMPGGVRVVARLGNAASVVFLIRVEGNLTTIVGDDGDGNEMDVAGALDQSCADATGEFAEACAFLFGLGSGSDQQTAIRQLTPEQVAAQGTAALRGPAVQSRNVQGRLSALRGGVGRIAIDQLAFNIQGEGVSVGPVRRAVRGEVTADAKLLHGVDQALSKAQPDAGTFEVRGGAASADEPLEEPGEGRWGVFVNGRVSIGDVPRSGREAGYDFTTEGITAGVDYRVNDRLVLGVATGYLTSDADVQGDRGDIDVSGYAVSLYGTWYLENLYVDAIASYGWNEYELTRTIMLPRLFRNQRRFLARGTPDSTQQALNLGVGYEHTFGALSFSTFGRLSHVRADVDGYTETGAGPFNLSFGEQEIESTLSEVGLDLAYPVSISWGVLQPTLRVSYLHEFEDDSRLIRARFDRDPSNTQFLVRTDDPDRDFFNVGAGLVATFPRGLATYLQYDTDLARDDLDIYTISGGVRMQF